MKLRHLLLSLVALVVVPMAWGQGCFPTSPNYTETVDMYVNTPANQTPPSTVYHEVDMAGTVTMNLSYCPPNIYHYASVYNQLAGVGGWTNGSQVCPNCYTSATSTQTRAYTANQTGTVTEGSHVTCTHSGMFFSLSNLAYNYEEAVTKSVQIGQSTNYPAYWKLAPWCTPASGTPDWNPNAIVPGANQPVYPYYSSFNICVRRTTAAAGSPWSCFSYFHPLVIGDTDSTKESCTNWDNGTEGVWLDLDFFGVTWIILKSGLGL